MSWAMRRRLVILAIVGGVLIAGSLLLWTFFFQEAPTCFDGVRNQDETTIDCGGVCAGKCLSNQEPPTVLFTKALTTSEGKTAVLAAIENKNLDAAARAVAYRITLFGADQGFIQEAVGTVDLLPGSVAFVFVPNIASGKQPVAQAFLSFDPASLRWFRFVPEPNRLPAVIATRSSGSEAAPRIEAVLENRRTIPLSNVQVVVVVRDTNGTVIAASSTIVPTISPQDQATAIVSWTTPFSAPVGTITVSPIIPLP